MKHHLHRSKLFFTLSLTVLTASSFLLQSSQGTPGVFALASLISSQTESQIDGTIQSTNQVQTQEGDEVNCTVEPLAEKVKPIYDGKFLSIHQDEVVVPGQVFKVDVYMQNTGNTPWFSKDSGCASGAIVNLGTEKARDRVSPFYNNLQNMQSNWISSNRVKMASKRVEPGSIAIFSFVAWAPEEEGIYREFFAPVAEGVQWIGGDAVFATDINVGGVVPNEVQSKYLQYIEYSTNLTNLDLSGEKNIDVSLSQQKMWIKIGETVIRTFQVSTGKSATPTPRGEYSIMLKQEVRVGGKAPHYIMPKFQMFKAGGYGIHALPSLANDKGVFWNEALNHIGSARSHGCIRLLPADAEFAFNFTEVGTKMKVHK